MNHQRIIIGEQEEEWFLKALSFHPAITSCIKEESTVSGYVKYDLNFTVPIDEEARNYTIFNLGYQAALHQQQAGVQREIADVLSSMAGTSGEVEINR